MKNNRKGKAKLLTSVAASVLTIAMMATLVACDPTVSSSSSDDYVQNSNQTDVKGEYETIVDDPDMLADGTSGMSIHEEVGDDALQQDRVSGGSNTGGVSSQNLPQLESSLIEPKEVRDSEQ